MRFCLFFMIVFYALAPSAQAASRATQAVADLSQDFVAVNEGFSGARLMVFGLLKSWSDVAIVIEGPPAQARLRTKKKIFGIWVNGEPEIFEDVPSYYAVVTSRPVAKMISESMAKKFGIGTDALPFVKKGAGEGIVATQKAKGLYQDTTEGVRILENKLFRADILLPASVPIGTYKAHIYEFSNGQFVASRTEDMKVAQVGLGARISDMSKSRPLAYGVLSLLLSLGVGGGAAYLFRRRT